MNPKATCPIGNKVEDLVVRGSAYFGFGDNTYRGQGTSRIHQRGVESPSTTRRNYPALGEEISYDR